MAKDIPVMKFGGVTMQGLNRFGPDEQRLHDECLRLNDVTEMYGLLASRRNQARAQRLREIAQNFILPLTQKKVFPVVVVSAFDWATDKLAELAATISANPHPREYARLLMTGELRANAAMALALQDLGQPAYSLTGREAGIITDCHFVDALIVEVKINYVRKLLKRQIVPVVAGFQGYFRDENEKRDEVSILGRGGSNLTAVALAHALGQPECTMFSDVDGLYNKNPKKYPDAKKIDQITGTKLLQKFKAENWPQVIQKEAVEFALKKGVNIWIRSGFEPEKPGSLIICRE